MGNYNVFYQLRKHDGFSLIELMTVLAVMSLLFAIALPLYMGFRDTGRAKVFIATAKGSVGELQSWAQSAISHQTDLRLNDTNCDGELDDDDKTNEELFSDGIAETYVDCRNNGKMELSPWSETLPMWKHDEPSTEGQITLVEVKGSSITVIAKGQSGDILFEQLIPY